MISLLIILALVMVPLALIARLSFTVLARLLGVVSQSEVTTRAEFARIREQLLATAGDAEESSRQGESQLSARVMTQTTDTVEQLPGKKFGTSRDTIGGRAPADPAESQAPSEPSVAQWRQCPTCSASVPSSASVCLQCGAGLALS
jgi:hypothetical protein